MDSNVLIVKGGWDGHEPDLIAERFGNFLDKSGFTVEITDSLDVLDDRSRLLSLDLFVPVWTMGFLPKDKVHPLIEAVGSGVGIAGCHGGMCDAFRENIAWQFMTGGNWVSHPGGDGVTYTVNIRHSSSPLTEDIRDFKVTSEHYYLHVDPAVEVLATTRFPVVDWYHSTNGEVDMPVIWTKRWGHGRVFYNSLGHHDDIFEIPEAWKLMQRGLLWAAEGKRIAREQGLTADRFKSERKMF